MTRALGFLSAALGCVLLTAGASAQPVPSGGSSAVRLGVFWNYNVNQQRVSFQKLPDVPNCCPEFEDALGTGFTAGALVDIPLGARWMLSLRGSYGTHNATITDNELLSASRDGLPVNAEIKHAIDAKLSSVDFDAVAALRLFGGLNAHLGGRLGYYIAATYDQNESLVKPYSFGTFENGRRVRNEKSGDIPGLKSTSASLLLGLSYHLGLNRQSSVILAPELYYILNLTPVVSDLAWNADAIHVGLSFKFNIAGTSEEDDEGRGEYEEWKREKGRTGEQPQGARDTDAAAVPDGGLQEGPPPSGTDGQVLPKGRVYEDDVDETGKPLPTPPEKVKEEPVPDAVSRKNLEPIPTDRDISPSSERETAVLPTVKPGTVQKGIPLDDLAVEAVGINAAGIERTFQTIEAEEFGVTDVVTLLNYVFFRDNSSQIPTRYVLLDKEKARNFRIGDLDAGDKLRQHYNVLNVLGSRLRDYPDAIVTIVGCNAAAGDEAGRLDLSRSRAESVRDYLTQVWDVNVQRMRLVSRNLPERPSAGTSDERADENRRVEIYSDTWEILRPIVWSRTEWRSTPAAVRFDLPSTENGDIERWQFSVLQDQSVMKEYTGSVVLPESLDWNITREQPFRTGLEEPLEYHLQIETKDGRSFRSPAGRIPVALTSVQDKRIAGKPDMEFTRYHLIVFDEGEEATAEYKESVTEMVTSIFGTDAVITVIGMDIGGDDAASYADTPLRIGMNDMELNTGLPEGRFYSRALRVLVEVPAAAR